MTWTLQYGSTIKTLAEWKCHGTTRNLVSQALDTVSFSMRSSSNPYAFDRNSTLTIRKDDAIWFVGELRQVPHSNAPEAERDNYVLWGPWNWFERVTYQQEWNILHSGVLQYFWTSHVMLNSIKATWTNTAGQIKAAVDLAIQSQIVTTGAALINSPVIGINIDLPTMFPPIVEVRSRTIAEVIKSQLAWHPDATTWFTMNANGKWDFFCKTKDKLAATTYDWAPATGNKYLHSVELTPRWDLVRPGVILRYEKNGTYEGAPTFEVVEDKYPANVSSFARDVYLETIDLKGLVKTTLRRTIEVAPIIDAAGNDLLQTLDWWKTYSPQLNDPEIVESTLKFAAVSTDHPAPHRKDGSLYLPNILIAGEIADWMRRDDGALGSSESDSAEAYFDCDFKTVTTSRKHKDKLGWRIPIQFTATDLETGTYSTFSEFTQADWTPVGLAQVLYAVFQTTQYEGTVTMRERELSGRMAMGSLINIAGHRAEYETMNGLPQSIQERIPDDGPAETTVNCGVAAHLDVPGLLSLLR